MKVVLAGGTGFLGAPLAARLAGDGEEVVVLTRGLSHASSAANVRFIKWSPGQADSHAWTREVETANVVVNLSGESIAGARWSAAHKARIRDSRLSATRLLVDAMRASPAPPVLVSGSAVGYYGPRGD